MMKKTLSVVSALILISIFAVSCAPKDLSKDIAVIVALTQTAAALQQPALSVSATAEPQQPTAIPTQVPVTEPTQTPAAAPTQAPVVAAGYQPFNIDQCNALKDDLSAGIGYPGVVIAPVPFEDFINKKTGLGCEITISQTGQYVTDMNALMNPAKGVMDGQGWTIDQAYGVAGAGAIGWAYRKDATICMTVFSMQETDPALCPGNEPVSVCWSRLAPEQLKYSAKLNCSTYVP